jgi:hypothetical protein
MKSKVFQSYPLSQSWRVVVENFNTTASARPALAPRGASNA